MHKTSPPLAARSCLTRKRPTKESKGALSTKARAKRRNISYLYPPTHRDTSELIHPKPEHL